MGLIRPDRYLSDVTKVDLDDLRTAGVRAVLLDLDNTILPRDRHDVPPELETWVRSLPEAGFAVSFVSNNWHESVYARAAALGVDIVAKAFKPAPFAFLIALGRLGFRPRQTVVIGDQLFTDVIGGNLIGAMTVLVKPLSRSDLQHTLLLRRLERVILADREPEA
jgi:hypothetical protein